MLQNPEKKPKQQNVWQFQEAKAKLSQVMDIVQETGMQTIVRNRDEVYIILSKEQYEKCTRSSDSLLEFFMKAPCPDVELNIERSPEGIREVDL